MNIMRFGRSVDVLEENKNGLNFYTLILLFRAGYVVHFVLNLGLASCS